MGFTRHIYPEFNFVFTQCYGIIDDNSIRVQILSFNIEAKGMVNIRELADARKLENAAKVTVQGLVQLSELGKERAAGRGGRLAIVADNPLVHDMACIYANLVKDIKKATGVFYDVKEALAWLEYDEKEIGTLLRFMKKNQV